MDNRKGKINSVAVLTNPKMKEVKYIPVTDIIITSDDKNEKYTFGDFLNAFDLLKESHTDLQNNFKKLKESHGDLQNNFKKLEENHNVLAKNYNKLLDILMNKEVM